MKEGQEAWIFVCSHCGCPNGAGVIGEHDDNCPRLGGDCSYVKIDVAAVLQVVATTNLGLEQHQRVLGDQHKESCPGCTVRMANGFKAIAHLLP